VLFRSRVFQGHHGQVQSVAFSPDGQRVLTGSRDATARLWDAATGKELRRLGEGPFGEAAFSPDGRVLVITSGRFAGPGPCKFFAVETGSKIQTLATPGGASPLAFSPDGRAVLLKTSCPCL